MEEKNARSALLKKEAERVAQDIQKAEKSIGAAKLRLAEEQQVK